MAQQSQNSPWNGALELLIEHGFDGAAEAMSVLINAAMVVERGAY